MQGMKALGPDGILAIIYEIQRPTIKEKLFKFIDDILVGRVSISGVNDTLLTLILKVNNPHSISQFWPTGFCNVNYKVLSKVFSSENSAVDKSACR